MKLDCCGDEKQISVFVGWWLCWLRGCGWFIFKLSPFDDCSSVAFPKACLRRFMASLADGPGWLWWIFWKRKFTPPAGDSGRLCSCWSDSLLSPPLLFCCWRESTKSNWSNWWWKDSLLKRHFLIWLLLVIVYGRQARLNMLLLKRLASIAIIMIRVLTEMYTRRLVRQSVCCRKDWFLYGCHLDSITNVHFP